MEVKRTHDKFYLDEDYKTEPKEYFKKAVEMIRSDCKYDESSIFDILDVGCETGSFLYFLNTVFPKSNLPVWM